MKTSFSASNVALATEVVATYLRLRVRLHRKDVRAVAEDIRALRSAAPAPDPQVAASVAARIDRAVWRTLGLLPGDSRCLIRSLVIASMLAPRGITARVVIGVKSDPIFSAHAWIETASRPVAAIEAGGYERIAEL